MYRKVEHMQRALSTILFVIIIITLFTGNRSILSSDSEVKNMKHKSANSDIKKNHNRLIHEKSPYLLQHAENPVDWYAWGPEAFEKARKENWFIVSSGFFKSLLSPGIPIYGVICMLE